jgi:tetratricopeptide (TPR) repeat protein
VVLAFLVLKIANSKIAKKISLHSEKIIMLFVLGSYMAITIPQNIFWRNDFTFGENQRMHFPNLAEPYQAISKYYFDAGRFDKSIDVLKMSLKYKPIDSLAYNDLGACYFYLGKADQAIESFKKAAQIRPTFSDAYYNLGMVSLVQFDFNKAVEYFKKAVEVDPDYADAYNNLGIAYLELKQYDDAQKAFEKVLQLSPRHELAQGNLDTVKRILTEQNKK